MSNLQQNDPNPTGEDAPKDKPQDQPQDKPEDKPEDKPQDKPETDKPGEDNKDDLTDEQIAKKLISIIDNANERILPLTEMIKKHIDKAKHDKENDSLDEKALVQAVKPLIEEATNILRETQGAIKALDPDGTIANSASRKSQDHNATKEEQHLAESLAKLTGEVTKAVEEAKDFIKDMPNLQKDLGPLLEAMTQPLFQIVSGVGLLLNGVLSLLGNILDGLGLGGLVRGVLDGLGLTKILKGLGLTGLFPPEKGKK